MVVPCVPEGPPWLPPPLPAAGGLLSPALPGEAHAPTGAGLVAAAVGIRARTGRGPGLSLSGTGGCRWTGVAPNRELESLERPSGAQGRHRPDRACRCRPREGRPRPEFPVGEKRDSGSRRAGRRPHSSSGRGAAAVALGEGGPPGSSRQLGRPVSVRDWLCRWNRQRNCLVSGLGGPHVRGISRPRLRMQLR